MLVYPVDEFVRVVGDFPLGCAGKWDIYKGISKVFGLIW